MWQMLVWLINWSFLGEKTKKPQKTLNPPNLTRKTAATGCLPILNQFKYYKGSFKKGIMLLYQFARFNGLAIPLPVFWSKMGEKFPLNGKNTPKIQNLQQQYPYFSQKKFYP